MNVKEIANSVLQGDRRGIAKAITLVESALHSDQLLSEQLLKLIVPHTGRALKIGISGVPGVGKSTFIEAFGLYLLKSNPGFKLAVMAVDPSSPICGGSVLGDKTRMDALATEDRAFIRPSPGGGALGGVARKSREAMYVLDAAGYDVVLIETIGVGQSEALVDSMVDFFVMLQMPNMGDELQGMKKGILELADLIAINKSDGDLLQAAERTKGEHEHALGLIGGGDQVPKVVLVSSLEKKDLDTVWDEISGKISQWKSDGRFSTKRTKQVREGFITELAFQVQEMSRRNPKTRALLSKYEDAVAHGTMAPATAAREYLSRILKEE